MSVRLVAWSARFVLVKKKIKINKKNPNNYNRIATTATLGLNKFKVLLVTNSILLDKESSNNL